MQALFEEIKEMGKLLSVLKEETRLIRMVLLPCVERTISMTLIFHLVHMSVGRGTAV